MITSGAFSYINVLDKAADASWLREATITNNLANVDTPGFKRKDVDFEGVFDRNSSSHKSLELQSKAKSMFDDAGIGLDLGAGYHRYYAFERSASMSRKSQLTFIRDDFYYPVRRRIMMDMELGDCQLSKLRI